MHLNKSPKLNKFINLTWQMCLDFCWTSKNICIVHYSHDIYNAQSCPFIVASGVERECNLLSEITNSIQFGFGGNCGRRWIDKLQLSNVNWPQIIVFDLPCRHRDKAVWFKCQIRGFTSSHNVSSIQQFCDEIFLRQIKLAENFIPAIELCFCRRQ